MSAVKREVRSIVMKKSERKVALQVPVKTKIPVSLEKPKMTFLDVFPFSV